MPPVASVETTEPSASASRARLRSPRVQAESRLEAGDSRRPGADAEPQREEDGEGAPALLPGGIAGQARRGAHRRPPFVATWMTGPSASPAQRSAAAAEGDHEVADSRARHDHARGGGAQLLVGHRRDHRVARLGGGPFPFPPPPRRTRQGRARGSAAQCAEHVEIEAQPLQRADRPGPHCSPAPPVEPAAEQGDFDGGLVVERRRDRGGRW